MLNEVFFDCLQTKESDLVSLFSPFGVVKAVKIIVDREGVPKGWVAFASIYFPRN